MSGWWVFGVGTFLTLFVCEQYGWLVGEVHTVAMYIRFSFTEVAT